MGVQRKELEISAHGLAKEDRDELECSARPRLLIPALILPLAPPKKKSEEKSFHLRSDSASLQ